MLTTQNGLNVHFSSPLGADVLGVIGLQGEEKACSLFCFTLSLFSLETDLDLSSLMGKPACLTLDIGKNLRRYFSGIIGEFQQGTTIPHDKGWQTLYTAKLFPAFWLLSFTKDYRIFQFMSAIDIIKKVLNENGISRLEDQTTTCGRTIREFCVQYGESHFNFVCRLMEEEGIFYSFIHTPDGDILVLNDDSLNVPTAEGNPFKIMTTRSSNTGPNQIESLNLQEQVVSKTYASTDYNFQTASVPLYTQLSGTGTTGKTYQYPGLYQTSTEGETLAAYRLEELEWLQKTIKGTSTAPGFCPLTKIDVSNHPRTDANRTYVIYKVIHNLSQVIQPQSDNTQIKTAFTQVNPYDPLTYKNDYIGFPNDISFRPPRITPAPLISSTQTARVTGKPGEEIWVDEYGRIKIKFHWDHYGSDDDKSSCWIRVAQVWAGNQWGSVWTPRVGMEVVVTFLDGNPDRPLITGCVYNSDQMPPYVNDEPTKSTLKSNSSKNGEGYNEFRFEDKKGQEEVYIQAEKDMKTLVKDARHLDIIAGNDTTIIHQRNRTVTLLGEDGESEQNDDPTHGNDTLILNKGSRLVDLKAMGDNPGNHTKHLSRGNDLTHIEEGNQNITLDLGDQSILLHKGNEDIVLDEGNQTITLKMGDQQLTLVNGNQTITLSEGDRTLTLSNGNESITIKGKRTLTITDDEEHLNQSDFSHTVLNDHTLKVCGNLNIEVLGKTTITSMGNFSLECMSNISLRAVGSFDIQAMNVTIQGAIQSSIEAGANLSLKSMATAEYEAGALNQIKGALVMINS